MERDSIAEELTLLAVVDTGSFSAAATQLGVSQSSVSRRIAALESRLGNVRLIARTTRRVEPTDIGERYIERIRHALCVLHDADQNVLSSGDDPSGLLRISLPPGIGLNRLLPALSALARSHSNLEFDVFLSGRYLDLYEGKLDLQVRLMPFRRTDTRLTDLGPIPWVFAASTGYLRSLRRPLRRDPDAFEFVVLNFRSGGPVDPGTQKIVRTLSQRHARLRVNETNSLRRLVLDGHGVGLLPWPVVVDDVRAGSLEVVDVGIPTSESHAYAICRRNLFETAKVQATLSAFQQIIAEDHVGCHRYAARV